jgi:hypothetical protein
MESIPTDTECATCKGNGLVWNHPGGPSGTPAQGGQTCPECNGRGRILPPYAGAPAVGRPKKADPGSLYAFAHQFYWDFRRLSAGRSRQLFDKKRYAKWEARLPKARIEITKRGMSRIENLVDNEILAAQLSSEERENRIIYIADAERSARRDQLYRVIAQRMTKRKKVPGEPEVVRILLDPNTTPNQIRELCRQAVMTISRKLGSETPEIEVSVWPIPAGSTLPTYLSQYAEQYVAALRDRRFPRCDVWMRPSNRRKQMWFASRALAGALFGVKTRTAINLVGSLRPEEIFEESRNAKSRRRRRGIRKH